MKLLNFLFVALLVLPTVVFAQDYHPFLRDYRTWDETAFGPDSFCSSGGRYHLEGDTTIFNNNYNSVLRTRFLTIPPSPCPPWYIDTLSVPTGMFIREDTVEKKVYILEYLNGEYNEFLLYDFNLAVGDTLGTMYSNSSDTLIVGKIDSVQILDGSYRKRFWVHDIYNYGELFYIEGIGSSVGSFFSLKIPFEVDINLICVKDNEIPIWGTNCDIPYVGIDEIDRNNKRNIDLFPQPASEFLYIDMKVSIIPSQIKIYNITGELQKQIKFDVVDSKAQIGDLSDGLYILQVFQDGKLIGVRNFVKQD